MKKILLILVAVLMTASVSAEDYIYIEDFEIDRSEWQAKVQLKAHFEDWVSAFQVELTLPYELTVHVYENEWVLNIEHEGQDGLLVDYMPMVSTSPRQTKLIVLSMEMDYYQGQPVGVCKYAPGDYEFFELVFDVPMGWEPTGDIGVYSITTCGNDKREWVHRCTTCRVNTTTHIEMVGEAELPPKPTDSGYWIVMDDSAPFEIGLDEPLEVWYSSWYELATHHYIIEGKEMGAFRPNQATYLNDKNPLINGDNNYTLVGMGNAYTLTLRQDGEDYYVECSRTGGVDDVNEVAEDKQVKAVRYYNTMGQQMSEPHGITIVETEYTDGSTTTQKILK